MLVIFRDVISGLLLTSIFVDCYNGDITLAMMRKPGLKLLLVIFSLFLGSLASLEPARAAFSLSAVPYRGTYDINFDKVTALTGRVNREVTVTVNSDIGKQYRILQTMIYPLSASGGKSIPQDAFKVYCIQASNKFGTSHVEQQTNVLSTRQLIYTSNSSGTSDSFILVFGILPSADITTGYYRGKIAFILEAIGSTQEPVTVLLDVAADIEVESSIEIRTQTGIKSITLDPGRADTLMQPVLIDIKGGFGKQFRILQWAVEQPASAEGALLDWQAVNFAVREAKKGTANSDYVPLSAQQQVVYTSSILGEADSFVIEYRLGDLSGQKAGHYRTRIKYAVEETGGGMKLIDTLSLEIENPRIFDIVLYPENQKGAIEFANLKPAGETRVNEMVIEVKSNAGRRYQVTQNTQSELMNKAGEKIRAERFTLRTESLETKGTLRFPAAENVKAGQSVLFISDDKGSSDKFKVVYELVPGRDLKSGDYSTRITYSLSEI